jgi:glycosyltransferase involved in cell wall biosynthesis
MSHNDVGGNILVMADYFGFKLTEDYILPSPKIFQVNQGLPIAMINLLYNCSDAVLSTTLGEGWGLSITEAMATKTPIVAPDNTSLHEMMADNRGYLVPSGDNPSAWFNLGSADNERLRPLMNVDKAADAIEKLIKGELPDIEGAYKWAQNNSWDNICKQWEKVFDKASIYAEHLNNLTQPNRAQRRAKAKR